MCGFKKNLLSEKQIGNLFLGCFLVLLGKQDSLDVGQHTTGSDGHSRQKFVQFFVVTDSQLKMSWDDSRFLVVSGSGPRSQRSINQDKTTSN